MIWWKCQHWFSARFREPSEPQPLTQGLTVLANYGAVQKCGRGDRDLRIHETSYTRGFYCHATSRFLVRTERPVRALTATVGVDSNSQTRPGRGSIVFVVSAGEREIYRSEVLHEGRTRRARSRGIAGHSRVHAWKWKMGPTGSPAIKRIGPMRSSSSKTAT